MFRLVAAFFLFNISVATAQIATVPAQTPDNVIVGFYNIKWFGHQDQDLAKLARVIQNFDICVVLEVKRESNLQKLHHALEKQSGQEDWNYTFGMRSRSLANHYFEAYAVFWNETRVQLGQGLVGGIWDFKDQFRHDPYIASFKADDFDFSLFAVHTRWSNDTFGTRDSELKAIAEQVRFLANFLPESDIIVGGDFNYPADEPKMEAMADAGNLVLISKNEPTTFKKNGQSYNNAYDHIYITPSLLRRNPQAHAFDTTTYIYGDKNVDHMKASRHDLSDHLPVFVVLDRKTPQQRDDR